MATIGIEVVDAALVAVREGVRVAASPGVALMAPEGLRVNGVVPGPTWARMLSSASFVLANIWSTAAPATSTIC